MDHGRGDACGGKTGEKTGKGCCTTFSILYISDALVPNTMVEVTIKGQPSRAGRSRKKKKRGKEREKKRRVGRRVKEVKGEQKKKKEMS
jgi:hypothetical protein